MLSIEEIREKMIDNGIRITPEKIKIAELVLDLLKEEKKIVEETAEFINECQTYEAADKIRLAEYFKTAIKENKKQGDNEQYMRSLGIILAGFHGN